MAAPRNKFKETLKKKKMQLGFWQSLASTSTCEISAQIGFDWLLIDGEHAPNDIANIADLLRVIDPSDSQAVVRVVAGIPHIIKQVLDAGAQSILVPMVDTAEQAREMVRAVRYPPDGIRGAALVTRAAQYGNVENYAPTANDEICLLVQAESKTAIENLDEICAVEGLDGVFIGPFDLAASMGFIHDPNNEVVQKTIEQAISKIVSSGKAAGILMLDEIRAKKYIEMGALFVAVGTDVSTFSNATKKLLANYRGSNFSPNSNSVY